MAEEILELKFEGNLINPSRIHPKEIAELINNFTDTLLATVKQENPEINTDELLFTFSNVDDKSLDLRFVIHKAQQAVLASYFLISTSINQSNYNKLNNDAIEGLKNITKFSKKYNCQGSFRHNNQSLSQFTPTTEVRLEKENEVKGETIIYGLVLRVGGEKPTIHFKVDNEYRIVFDTKEDIAKKLAQKLYDEVGLRGVAKWDIKSYKVIDFTVSDIVEIETKPIVDTFNELSDLIGKYWDNIDNVQNVID